jgi:hypothetical protein
MCPSTAYCYAGLHRTLQKDGSGKLIRKFHAPSLRPPIGLTHPRAAANPNSARSSGRVSAASSHSSNVVLGIFPRVHLSQDDGPHRNLPPQSSRLTFRDSTDRFLASIRCCVTFSCVRPLLERINLRVDIARAPIPAPSVNGVRSMIRHPTTGERPRCINQCRHAPTCWQTERRSAPAILAVSRQPNA